MEIQFDTQKKTLYSDNYGEYQGLSHLLAHHGIQHLKSLPYTPQLVSTIEYKLWHRVETGIALLQHNYVSCNISP